MKKLSIAIIAGGLWVAGSLFAQTSGGTTNTPSAPVTRPCDKDGDGKCDTCGRAVGQGRAQAFGQGRGRMMAMRGRGTGRGNGPCMRMGRAFTAEPEPAPKTDNR
jgi:hypothetical protein